MKLISKVKVHARRYTHTFMPVYMHAVCRYFIPADCIHAHPVMTPCVSTCVYLVKLPVSKPILTLLVTN